LLSLSLSRLTACSQDLQIAGNPTLGLDGRTLKNTQTNYNFSKMYGPTPGASMTTTGDGYLK